MQCPPVVHCINMPEVTLKMSMPVLAGKVMSDVDWMRDGNAVCRYFTDTRHLDCHVGYSPVVLPATTIPGQSGPARAERLMVFPAARVHVSAVEGIHAMRFVWTVKGCKPVDDAHLSAHSRSLPSGQSVPVIFAELSLSDLFTGEAGRMTIGTLPVSSGEPGKFCSLFDILHEKVQTHAPENENSHMVLEVGVRHTPLSLSSKEQALALHKQFHFSSESIATELVAISATRQNDCHEFLQMFTSKETDAQCAMSMIQLNTGCEAFNSKKVDWAQWSESLDTHTELVLDMLVPELVNACVEVGHAQAAKFNLSGPEGMLKALQQTDANVLTTLMHEEISLHTACNERYCFDPLMQFDMSAVTSSDKLTVYSSIKPSGENQNPTGYLSKCSMIVNESMLIPIMADIEKQLATLLGKPPPITIQVGAPITGTGLPAGHTPPFDEMTAQVKALVIDLSRLKLSLQATGTQGDCEDVSMKITATFNSIFPLSDEHHAALLSLASPSHMQVGAPLAGPVLPDGRSKLERWLVQYALADPELAPYMPAVQYAILSAASTGRRLNSVLVLASGAKLDMASSAALVPATVDGPQGVFAKVQEGMAQSALSGHCVTAETIMGPLDAADPAHAALAKIQVTGKCEGFSLETNISSTYYEGTGAALQVADSLSDRVSLKFAPVADTQLQLKLNSLAATPLAAYQATNLITAIQSQAMTESGMCAGVVQKFSLADTGGFYRNMLSCGAGTAFTTDGVSLAPTAYIPTVHDSSFTRMILNTPCSALEKTRIGMLYRARRAMNPSMDDVLATTAMAGVSRPPMRFRGIQTVQHQTGTMSSIVVKNPCFYAAGPTNWPEENKARAAVALSHGMVSFRNISSEIWIANFCTNPTTA